MATRIRLKRIGAHKAPFYRLVVSDSRSPRDGRFIEEIGTYNPITNPATVNIDEEKALRWLQTGAQASDTVRSLFSKAGIMKKFHESKLQK
jgi:small subunit ribosomal protein S16